MTAYLQGVASDFSAEKFISIMGANNSGLQNSTKAAAFIAGTVATVVITKVLYAR